MRMLMGANGIYADGKAQPMSANGNLKKTIIFSEELFYLNRTYN